MLIGLLPFMLDNRSWFPYHLDGEACARKAKGERSCGVRHTVSYLSRYALIKKNFVPT
jgi:hypothetical protein